MAPILRRLHPSPTAVTSVPAAYDVARTRPIDRPWIALCMVSSIDGSIALDGTSSGLGNPNDLGVLLSMRAVADMVLVGAGTVRKERYGPAKKAGQRIGVVTDSGRLDLTVPLFASGSGFLIAPASADIDDDSVDVLRAGAHHVDLPDAMRRLHEIADDIDLVQAEGGPGLNGSLLAAGLVDEVNWSISPRLVGGDAPRLTTGAPETDTPFELAHLLTDDEGFLFTRWVRPAC